MKKFLFLIDVLIHKGFQKKDFLYYCNREIYQYNIPNLLYIYHIERLANVNSEKNKIIYCLLLI